MTSLVTLEIFTPDQGRDGQNQGAGGCEDAVDGRRRLVTADLPRWHPVRRTGGGTKGGAGPSLGCAPGGTAPS
jgi:hypothetical protein